MRIDQVRIAQDLISRRRNLQEAIAVAKVADTGSVKVETTGSYRKDALIIFSPRIIREALLEPDLARVESELRDLGVEVPD